jgi:hypothetical protein
MIDTKAAQVRRLEHVLQVVAATHALELRRAEDDEGRDGWIAQVLRKSRGMSVKAARPALMTMQAHAGPGHTLWKLGLTEERAWRSATNGRGAWWNAGANYMNAAFPKSVFDHVGLVSLVDDHRRFQRQS